MSAAVFTTLAPLDDAAAAPGFMVGQLIAVLLLLRGAQLMRRPDYNFKCLLGFMLLPGTGLATSVLNMNLVTELLGKSLPAMVTVALVMLALPVAALLGLLGWIEIQRRPKSARPRGRLIAFGTFLLTGLGCVGLVAEFAGKSGAGLRGEQLADYDAPPAPPARTGPTTIRDELRNFQLEVPPPWTQVTPTVRDTGTRLQFIRSDPMTHFMVTVEEIGIDIPLELDGLLDAQDAQLRASAVTATCGTWMAHSVAGIAGKRSTTLATMQKLNVMFDRWYGIADGRVFGLIVWCRSGAVPPPELARRADEVHRSLRILQPGRAATATTSEVSKLSSAEFGYEWTLGPGWRQWPTRSQDCPGAEDGAIGFAAGTAVFPVRMPVAVVEPTLVARALLRLLDPEIDERSSASRRRFEQNGSTGFEFEYTKRHDGKDFRYRVRAYLEAERAALVAAWCHDKVAPTHDLSAVVTGFRWQPAAAPQLETKQLSADRSRDASFQRELASLLRAAGRLSDATQLLADACVWQPSDARNLLARLDCLLDSQSYEEVLAVVTEARQLHGDHLRLLSYHPFALAKLDQRDAAIAGYQDLFQRGFRDEADLSLCAELLVDADNVDAALQLIAEHWRPATSVSALLAKARVWRRAGQHEEAIAALVDRRRSAAPNAELEWALAAAYRDAGRGIDAIPVLDQLLANGNDNQATHLLKAAVQCDLGHFPAARTTLMAALDAHPGDAQIQQHLDGVNGMLGRGSSISIRRPIAPVPAIDLASVTRPMPIDWATGADAVVLEHAVAVHFVAGKELRTTTRMRIQIRTARGASDHGSLSFAFDPLVEAIHGNRLVVRDASGREVAQGNREDWYVLDDSDSLMDTGGKLLRLPVPGLAAGHILEVETTRQRLEAPRQLPFQRHAMGGPDPTWLQVVSLSGDAAQSPFLASPTVSTLTTPTARVYLVEGEPGHRFEARSPESARWLPWLAFGEEGADWQSVAAPYQQSLARDVPPEDLSEVVAANTTAGELPEARANRLARFVQNTLHYRAIEFGVRGTKPNPSSKTLALRYGDCKDHSVLLRDLLQTSGIRAELALVATTEPVIAELPSLGQFDHMVVYCPEIGGGHVFDVTDKASDTSLRVPTGLAQRQLLVLTKDPALVPMPDYAPADCRVEVTMELHFDRDGALTAEESVVFHGHFAGLTRQWFLGRDANERLALLQSTLAATAPGLRVDSCELLAETDTAQPLQLRQRYRIPRPTGGGPGTLPIGWASTLLALEPTVRRTAPLHQKYPLTITMLCRVTTDDGTVETTVPDLHPKWRGRFGAGQVRITADGGELRVAAALKQASGVFNSEEFEAAQAFFDEMLAGLAVPLRRR
jgi:tetratricopeptide (TPR) repeat protein